MSRPARPIHFPTSEEYLKTCEKKFGIANVSVHEPWYSWVVCVIDKHGVKQYKIFAGPYECRPGTKNASNEAWGKLEEINETGFIHASKSDNKGIVTDELRAILPIAEEKKKKKFLGVF